MSFVNKFRPAGNNPPPGVKIEHTSFGYAQNQKPYTMPQLPKQTAPTQKVQPRGGWDDDDDDEPQLRGGNGAARGNPFPSQTNTKMAFVQSPVTPSSAKSDELSLGPNKRGNPAKDYELMQIDESFLASHGFENKTINDLIQPGGARVKQADSALNSFCKACESFQAPVIGSLLMSKLYEEIPFVSKARTLYLIEALIKKVKKYFDYVKHNINILKGVDYSNDQSADQLRKLTNDITQYIEEPNKPKPQPVFTNTQATYNPTVAQSTNLLGDNDLLGSPEAKTSKPDPFAFVKKQSPEPVRNQPSFNKPTAPQNNAQLLDLDFGSQSPLPQQQQSQNQAFSQPPVQSQPQAQPKKFNPFEIPSTPPAQTQNKPQPVTENLNQNASKPGAGLNFKKFQGNPTQSQATPAPAQQQPFINTNNKPVTPVNQASNNMNDLLGSFSGLDFSSNNHTTQPSSSSPGGLPFKSSSPLVQGTSTQNKSSPSSNFSANMGPQNSFPTTSGPSSVGYNQPNVSAFTPSMSNMTNMQPTNSSFPSYGPSGNMGSGPSNYGPGYGYGPSGGFNNPSGFNAGYQGGYGGFNAPTGPGYNYGQQGYPTGNFNQPQTYGFGGNNFQNQNGMSGGGSYYNQPSVQGMSSYYSQAGVFDDLTASPGLRSSEEAAARQEEMKRKQEKQKNEALFDSLRF